MKIYIPHPKYGDHMPAENMKILFQSDNGKTYLIEDLINVIRPELLKEMKQQLETTQ
jgi:hypothetical protein